MEFMVGVHLYPGFKPKHMKTKIGILVVLFLAMWAIQATPTRTVTGKVTAADGSRIPAVNVMLKGTQSTTITNERGEYSLIIPGENGTLVFSFIGYATKEMIIGTRSSVDVTLEVDVKSLSEVVVGSGREEKGDDLSLAPRLREGRSTGEPSRHKVKDGPKLSMSYEPAPTVAPQDWQQPDFNTEEYDGINENIFHETLHNPLSTFSIDVDAASYSNIRRFINNGQRPPKDAVRIEEMINYFNYDYQQPQGEDPFAIYTEISTAPWNEKHKLVHIGLQGKTIPTKNLPPSNLVFLIDVSGSMSDPNKLPLLKSSFKMLVEQLREQDKVAIVVYAGAAGVVLPSTSGAEKKKIIRALDELQAGGSTAGGAGIRLAYAIAKENFQKQGNNRVIIATDGDFNVGESSNASMERLVEEKRNDGIFLTVLGFGMGNYKDSKMETLADKGNGNYAYIDTILEAQKVLVNEFGGTLFTIAKDVKLQIEFNPANVTAYRLIGYENRVLKNEDFNNDKKDAGELGSGHTVTALYEIIPVGVESPFFKIDDLKYQTPKVDASAVKAKELMTVKFRYKRPNEDVSKLIVHPLIDEGSKLDKASENFRWSAAVAGFGMLLRDSEYVKGYSIDQVLQLAQGARGNDPEGYRIEFINLVKTQGLTASR